MTEPISTLFSTPAVQQSVIKSVQRGVIAFPGSYPVTVEVAISPVNPLKAVVSLLGCVSGTGSSYMTIDLKNATTIRGMSNAAVVSSINWEVVEYI